MVQIIAEVCQNHNGNMGLLKEMVQAAAEVGAHYCKMQSIKSSELVKRDKFETGEGAIKRPFQPEYVRLKDLDMSEEDTVKFIEMCTDANIAPMTSIFTHGVLDFLAQQKWNSIKVPSYDCASGALLRRIRDKFSNVIISTGASYNSEIAQAAHLMHGHNFAFLHCVTIYPTPLSQLHLSRMKWLRQLTKTVGFTDHTLTARDGLLASKYAMALGADIIERHFSLLPDDQTKDGPVSVNKEQLKELVRFSKLSRAEMMTELKGIDKGLLRMMEGDATRELSREELRNRDYYRGRFASKKDGKIINNWSTW